MGCTHDCRGGFGNEHVEEPFGFPKGLLLHVTIERFNMSRVHIEVPDRARINP